MFVYIQLIYLRVFGSIQTVVVLYSAFWLQKIKFLASCSSKSSVKILKFIWDLLSASMENFAQMKVPP